MKVKGERELLKIGQGRLRARFLEIFVRMITWKNNRDLYKKWLMKLRKELLVSRTEHDVTRGRKLYQITVQLY